MSRVLEVVEKRKQESAKVRAEYPDRLPIICEKYKDSKVASLDKAKFLVPSSLSSGQLISVIRKRAKLPKDTVIFMYVNGKVALKADTPLLQVYEKMKDEDGFLYIAYAGENVLGSTFV